MKRLSVVMIIVMVLSLLLTACGSAPSGGDPVSVVKAAMAAVTSKQFDKLSEFACAAKKDAVTGQFNPAAALSQGMGKEDAQKLLDAMTISFDNAEFGTPTITGDSASIPMKGKMSLKFDKEKLKVVLKSMLATQGLANATDDQINQALDMVSSQLEQGQSVDTTVDLIKENGKWVLCTK